MDLALNQFTFDVKTKIVYGAGVHQQAGSICRDLGLGRALLITDPVLVKNGLVDKVTGCLEDHGITVIVYDGVDHEPTEKNVQSGVDIVSESQPDIMMALGGGSVMDCAKCINIMAHNPGSIVDYEGVNSNFTKDSPVPLIALPTTSGTGAEIAAWAVITDTSRNYKMSLGSSFLGPEYALVDPLLTIDLPPRATAYSGMDALSQAMEGMLSIRRSPITHQLGLFAIKLIAENIGVATRRGWDLQARANMSLGSLLGGINMVLGGCIIVHSIAETLGGLYHLPHGLTVGLVLPHMLKFNAVGDYSLYADIAGALGVNISGTPTRDAAAQVILRVNQMLNDLEFPTFKDVGLKEADIPEIARLSFNNPSTADNPYALTIGDFEKILLGCLHDEREGISL